MTQAKLAEMRAIIDFMRTQCHTTKCPITYVMQITTQGFSMLSPGEKSVIPRLAPHSANEPATQ